MKWNKYPEVTPTISNKHYLLYYPDNNELWKIDFALYKDLSFWDTIEDELEKLNDPTHWMELPETPKDE